MADDGCMKRKIISTDPEVMGGTPCFAGTRVPVQTLLDYLEAGDSIDEFLKGFPTVKRAQVAGAAICAVDADVSCVDPRRMYRCPARGPGPPTPGLLRTYQRSCNGGPRPLLSRCQSAPRSDTRKKKRPSIPG